MKTITLFDIAREHGINTVNYSAHPETLQRWQGENLVVLENGYAFVEPRNETTGLPLPEHWVEFGADKEAGLSCQPLWSSLPWEQVSIEVYQLADILYTDFDMERFKLYFYDNGHISYISGVE